MAIFTTHAVIPVKGAGPLRLGDIECMAADAAGRGFGLEMKNASHSFTNVAGKRTKGMCVFVLHCPGAIFVLQYGGLGAWLHAAVTTGGTARPRSGVLCRRIGRPQEGCQQSKHKY